MIQIIEKGTRSIKLCYDCGCKFSFEFSDISYEKERDSKGLTVVVNSSKHIVCPQCGKKIYLDPESKFKKNNYKKIYTNTRVRNKCL